MNHTQTYFALVAGDKKTKGLSVATEKSIGLITSMVFDLLDKKAIILNEKGKLSSQVSQLPENNQENYLLPLFSLIQKNEPIKPEKLMNYYLNSFKNKLTIVFQEIGDVLVAEEKATKTEEKSFFSSGTFYSITPQYLASLKEELKNSILKENTTSQLVLLFSLDTAHVLKNYLSKEDMKIVKEKLKSFQQQPEGKLCKQLLDELINLQAAITTTAVTTIIL